MDFFQQLCTTYTSLNSTTNGEPRVPVPKARKDISHSNHHVPLPGFHRLMGITLYKMHLVHLQKSPLWGTFVTLFKSLKSET